MKLRKVWKEGSTTNANESFYWKVDSKYVKFGSAIGGRKWKTMLTVPRTIWKLHIRTRNRFQKTSWLKTSKAAWSSAWLTAQLNYLNVLKLREKFSEFAPIFKNCEVSLEDIGPHMKDFAHENNLKKPRRMLISSFCLKRGPVFTPLLQLYLEKGLVLIPVYWFIQYTPENCFESSVKSVVEARREGDRNTSSSVVAETMKLIGNSSYGYHIMDRSKHSTTQYVSVWFSILCPIQIF